MKRGVVLIVAVLLLAPPAANAKTPLMQRVVRPLTQRIGPTLKRMNLKGHLARLGNSAVGRTARRAATPVLPLGGQALGRRDRRAHLGKRGWLKLDPVARDFTTRSSRLSYASGLLGRSLTAPQQAALIQAHRIGKGERGTNGRKTQISASGKGNYTFAQLRKKARILRKAGFNRQETRMLMARGVVGFGNVMVGAVILSSGVSIAATSEIPFAGMPMITLGALWMSGMFGEF